VHFTPSWTSDLFKKNKNFIFFSFKYRDDQAESTKVNNLEKLFLSAHIQGPTTPSDEINPEDVEELKFNASPFPAKRLGDAEIDELNSQFRKALNDKKLSNYDAFNLLDSN